MNFSPFISFKTFFNMNFGSLLFLMLIKALFVSFIIVLGKGVGFLICFLVLGAGIGGSFSSIIFGNLSINLKGG